jgi:hypothetical protein
VSTAAMPAIAAPIGDRSFLFRIPSPLTGSAPNRGDPLRILVSIDTSRNVEAIYPRVSRVVKQAFAIRARLRRVQPRSPGFRLTSISSGAYRYTGGSRNLEVSNVAG